jgi:hypothetical protein
MKLKRIDFKIEDYVLFFNGKLSSRQVEGMDDLNKLIRTVLKAQQDLKLGDAGRTQSQIEKEGEDDHQNIAEQIKERLKLA